VQASAARDVWAHRARLLIVRLGLHYQAIDHDEALSMLARADALWRGDDDALETLLDIERVATEAGHPKAAAIALGTLMMRHPMRRPQMRRGQGHWRICRNTIPQASLVRSSSTCSWQGTGGFCIFPLHGWLRVCLRRLCGSSCVGRRHCGGGAGVPANAGVPGS
jgi:hypothetical protein